MKKLNRPRKQKNTSYTYWAPEIHSETNKHIYESKGRKYFKYFVKSLLKNRVLLLA